MIRILGFVGIRGMPQGLCYLTLVTISAKVRRWQNRMTILCIIYRRNICPNNPESCICEDVHTLNIEHLGDIDALAFGFPCNDFSVIGEQLGFDGTYGSLYSYGIRVLRRNENLQDRPMWFLAENVGGLRSANDGNAFEQIQSDMRESGYKIYPHLYKFEDYGIPQARHKVIIIGIREDFPYEFHVPAPGYNRVACRQALEEPPIPADAPNVEHIFIIGLNLVNLQIGKEHGCRLFLIIMYSRERTGEKADRHGSSLHGR